MKKFIEDDLGFNIIKEDESFYTIDGEEIVSKNSLFLNKDGKYVDSTGREFSKDRINYYTNIENFRQCIISDIEYNVELLKIAIQYKIYHDRIVFINKLEKLYNMLNRIKEADND
jgi:hypothetical protein